MEATEQTRIDKATTFATNLAAMLTINQIIREAESQPDLIRQRLQNSMYEALLLNPSIAEA
tara:strand:+ start:434 stop:616 length:183 start_codon:yes stop_codon:yes gene_type:complete